MRREQDVQPLARHRARYSAERRATFRTVPAAVCGRYARAARPAMRVGCCGWPLARAAYFRRFSAVEINSSFYNLPLLATAARWRDQAPEGFEYALKAWQLITHPSSSPTYRRTSAKLSDRRRDRCGHFQRGDEVESAWQRTEAVARALGCAAVLFQTPRSFLPTADHVGDMRRFFKGVRRGAFLLAWEPRGDAWEESLVRRVCADLGLARARDPLAPDAAAATAPASDACYFRLHGRYESGRIVHDHAYRDDELEALGTLCEGRRGYVFFNNASRGEDAARFGDLRARAAAPRPSAVRSWAGGGRR